MRPRFHLAIPVDDLASSRAFYGDLLGCPEGRSAAHWVDFDFHGHQLVVHQAHVERPPVTNPVDGEAVPVPHFGLLMSLPDWKELAARLTRANIEFVIPPTLRFEGKPGEQWTMFLMDPSGNALEFKAFASDDDIFAKQL